MRNGPRPDQADLNDENEDEDDEIQIKKLNTNTIQIPSIKFEQQDKVKVDKSLVSINKVTFDQK